MQRWAAICLIVFAAMFPVACQKQAAPTQASVQGCPGGSGVVTNGHKRLALVVGIDDYASPDVNNLHGAVADARHMADLLAGPGGFAFPAQNTCVLLDAQATRNAFVSAFRTRLIERASPGDVVVIYFAGHGSQVEDLNGDEPDGRDETLLMQDARTPGEHDLVDDEFNALLAELSRKTANVSVFLDSCNSGTATRGASDPSMIARFQPPDTRLEAYQAVEAANRSSGPAWRPDSLRNVTVFAAAGDGTPALERNGSGVFTDALVRIAADASERPLTFGQLERRLRPLVAASSPQVPYVDGEVDRIVFDNVSRERPLSLVVDSVSGDKIQLSGPPLPGLGEGAELRVYSATASFDQMLDPAYMKALIRVDSAEQRVAAITEAIAPGKPAMEAGDIAVLARPSREAARLLVRFVSSDDARGAMRTLEAAVQHELSEAPEGASTISVSEQIGDFAVYVGSNGEAIISGPEGQARAVEPQGASQAILVAGRLIGFARERAILGLRGETSGALADARTVLLAAEPSTETGGCSAATWRQAAPGDPQAIPLCQRWRLSVRMDEHALRPMRVTVALLTSDGAIKLLSNPRGEPMHPGDMLLLPAGGEFMGSPPVSEDDYYVAFASYDTVQNDFSALDWDPAVGHRGGVAAGALARTIDRFITAGARGERVVAPESFNDTAWTMSTLRTHVEANPAYAHDASAAREYGVPDFDIRPYLPNDRSSALYRVLEVANSLAHTSRTAGYNYRQHDWTKASDEDNLRDGIDCSRAVWFAFTRAGVPYNRTNRYVSTAEMAQTQSSMLDDFASCTGSPQEIGDVLVYRDTTRGDGHVIMVIDPQQRIAWGSHGWDGNPIPHRGVEYQRIRNRVEWANWDRPTMRLIGCWRHRAFASQLATPGGRPGMMAGQSACGQQCPR